MSLSENSIDPQVLRIKDIPQNREGWVYLIHAVGTNRYKIGRSINPVARYSTLQKQSPYPLQIIDSFWTVDAMTDETWWHKELSEYRAYGEWFELTEEMVNDVACLMPYESRKKVCFGWSIEFMSKISKGIAGARIQQDYPLEDWHKIFLLFKEAYDAVNSREKLQQLDNYILHRLTRETKIAFGVYFSQEGFNEIEFNCFYYYIKGMLKGFTTALTLEDVVDG